MIAVMTPLAIVIALPVIWGAALLISAVTLWWFSTPQGINSINGLYNFTIQHVYNPAKQGLNNIRHGLFEFLLAVIEAGKSFGTFVTWITAQVANSAYKLSEWVKANIKDLADAIAATASAPAAYIATQIKNAVEAGSLAARDVADWAEGMMQDIAGALSQRIGFIEDWLANTLSPYLAEVVGRVNDVVAYVNNAIPPMNDWWNQFKDKIGRLIEEILDIADTLTDGKMADDLGNYLAAGGWLVDYINETYVPLAPEIYKTMKEGFDIEG